MNAIGVVQNRPTADFVAEDWDVLVLLDACRADYYRRHTPFDGTPQTLMVAWVCEPRMDGGDVRKAYAETLQIGLTAVERLLTYLDGRVVISADLGELLGERLVPGGPREWAHPKGLATTALRRVPWHVVQDGDRPDIVSGLPIEQEGLSDEEIHDRLAALGYAEE